MGELSQALAAAAEDPICASPRRHGRLGWDWRALECSLQARRTSVAADAKQQQQLQQQQRQEQQALPLLSLTLTLQTARKEHYSEDTMTVCNRFSLQPSSVAVVPSLV